jgi:uncharacterized protein YjbI with pentapeptide repeats
VSRLQRLWTAITTPRLVTATKTALPRVVEIADKVGKLAIIVTIASYFWEAPDRAKSRHYQAWQLIDLARGGPGDGGRRSALEDLVRENVALTGVDLSRANLDGLDLRSAKMDEAIFNLSSLNGTKFQCRGALNMSFDLSRLYNPCRHTELSGAVFKNARMTGTNFSGAAIYGATFEQDEALSAQQAYRGCIIQESASFDRARLQGTSFTNCVIVDTTFENAILLFVSFKGGSLSRLDFTEAILDDVNIDDGELLPATFSELASIDFAGAVLKNVKVNGKPVTDFDGHIFRLCHTEVDGTEVNRDCGLLGGSFSKRQLEWYPSVEDRANPSKWHDND